MFLHNCRFFNFNLQIISVARVTANLQAHVYAVWILIAAGSMSQIDVCCRDEETIIII